MGLPNNTEFLNQPVKIYQIICGAMIWGALFTAASLLFVFDWNKFNNGLGVIPMLGLILGITAFVSSFIIPGIVNKSALKVLSNKLDDQGHKFDSETGLNKIFATKQSASIIRYALLEGAVFANILFFFIDGSVYLLVTAAVGALIMIFMFPRKDPTLAWVEQTSNDMIKGRV